MTRIEAIANVFAAFGKPMDGPTAKVYIKALEELDDATLDRACMAVIRTAEYMPPPAVILKQAGQADADQAILAWERCLTRVRSAYRIEVRARDERTVKMIGCWDSIGMVSTTDLPFVQKRFVEAYGAAGREDRDEHKKLEGQVGNMLDDLGRSLDA